MEEDMDDPEKTQPLLAEDANEFLLQERAATLQERIPGLDEEQLEEVTGGGFLDCIGNCFGKTQPVTPQPDRVVSALNRYNLLTTNRTDAEAFVARQGYQAENHVSYSQPQDGIWRVGLIRKQAP